MNGNPLFSDMKQAFLNLPKYLLGYFGGFIVFIIADLNITSLFLAAVLAGILADTIILGLLVFFGGYVILKSIGGLGDAIFFAAAERNKVEAQKIPPPPA